MDKRAREIIGLPVVTMNRGTKIYDVEDMVLDTERSQVLALVVQEKAVFHSARALPFGRINVIGRDAVVVPDGRAIIDVNRDPVLKRLYNDQVVRGLRVLTDDGRKLGEVSDMQIDTKTGEIKGYYVSMGRGSIVGQGAKWLAADRVQSIGRRVIFIPAAVADELEQQVGGLAGALGNAGDRVRTAGSKFNTQLEQIGGQVHSSIPQRTTAFLVGKNAHNVVQDKDGNAIVMAGETITEENVDRARAAGRLPQLMMAVGQGPAKQGLGSIGEEAQQSLRSMPAEARDLWSQLTGRYNSVVDQADDRFLQRRIKHALGRPVTRVILDNADNIILNTGDIVTNRAIESARAAGVLDNLVDSVYTERPRLSLSDLKAPRSGDASLENVSGSTGTAPQPVTTSATLARNTAAAAATDATASPALNQSL